MTVADTRRPTVVPGGPRRPSASHLRGAAAIVGAAVTAAVVASVALVAIGQVEWPAFNSSNVTGALTTLGQTVAVVILLVAALLWRAGRAGRLVPLLGWVGISGFVTVTLAMPLGATKLYLFGISVDQQFRTEYLTRLADTAVPKDMTYYGLPPFYPPGWFWLGGRLAALTGTPAWEMFKPWSIISITVAAALALILWAALVRFEVALVVSTATVATTLAYSPAEPYAAVITVLLPPALVLGWSGLRGTARGGGGAAVVGTGLFLGVAALFYTLLLGYAAFTLTLMALVATAVRRRTGAPGRWSPLLRLLVIAAISGALWLVGLGPWLLAAITGDPADSGTAQHYLPADGAQLSFPMFGFTLLGALCLLGTVWLVLRCRTSTRAGDERSREEHVAPALGIAVLAVYAWSLLSMLTTLAGTTLLSFRLQPTLVVLLAAAGAFGFVEATQAVARRYQCQTGRRLVGVAVALGSIGAITFSQDIPDVLRSDLVVAYTDTDGHGQRADRRPPGAERYYREVDAAITRLTGRPRDETVVMTADYSFLSFYPYYGFQGLTSHYANPLAQFDRRAAAIERWATLTTPDQFVAALDELPFAPPTVFLMRRGANDTYSLRLASDVYPNQPNVKRYQVALDKAIFADARFDVSTIGPFVLAVRTDGKP